jgi:hypothetical protein
MTYIKKEKLDIPDWFDLNNYEKLKQLNVNSLIEELRDRVEIYQLLQDEDISLEGGKSYNVFPNTDKWKKLFQVNQSIIIQ